MSDQAIFPTDFEPLIEDLNGNESFGIYKSDSIEGDEGQKEVDINVLKTYFQGLMTVYEITTGDNDVHALPDATANPGEQTIKRRGSGSGKVTFTTVSSQTIDTLAPTQFELRGEVEITLVSDGSNWEQKSVVNDWVVVHEDYTLLVQTLTLDVIDGLYEVMVMNDDKTTITANATIAINEAGMPNIDTFQSPWDIAFIISYTVATSVWDTTLASYSVARIRRWQDRVKLAGL